MEAKNKYVDVKYFLLLIAFISAFNYYLTYSNIQFNWFLVITYTIDTVQGWLAWWALRSIVVYLDKTMPYTESLLKRIVVQVTTTTFAGLVIISLLTELVCLIAKGHFLLLDFYTFDVLIFIIWFLVLNGIYVGMHFYKEWNELNLRLQAEKKIVTTGFYVKNGKQDLLIAFPDLLGFYSESGVTYLQTVEDKTYLTERSLDNVEQALPGELFFRLNRKYLIHRNAVAGFKRVGDGKLEVQVNSHGSIPGAIGVSRIRAAEFKRWFQPVAV